MTEDQLEIISCVNKGDTLIFEADNGNRDTTVISDKGTYLQELNPIFGNNWYRPEVAFVKAYNTNRVKGRYYDLVDISAGRTPSHPARISLEMRDFSCFLSESYDSLGKLFSEPIEINGTKYINSFIIESYCEDCPINEDSCDIVKIYWSLEKGPLKYVDIKNIAWTRIR